MRRKQLLRIQRSIHGVLRKIHSLQTNLYPGKTRAIPLCLRVFEISNCPVKFASLGRVQKDEGPVSEIGLVL